MIYIPILPGRPCKVGPNQKCQNCLEDPFKAKGDVEMISARKLVVPASGIFVITGTTPEERVQEQNKAAHGRYCDSFVTCALLRVWKKKEVKDGIKKMTE